MIRTVDSDVFMLAIAAVDEAHIDELWVAFATGKSFRYLPAYQIAFSLCPRKSNALLFLLAFSRCDTVLSFAGRGKKTAWEIWKIYVEVTPAFFTLASNPGLKSISDQLEVLECFVMYDRTSTEMKVNEARKQLFSQKSRSVDGIPPTQAALLEHTKKAAYQAMGCCLSQNAIF